MRWFADQRTWERALKAARERADRERARFVKENHNANKPALHLQRLILLRILTKRLADQLKLVIDENRDRLLQAGVDPAALN